MKKLFIISTLILVISSIFYCRGLFWNIEKRSQIIDEAFEKRNYVCDEKTLIKQYFTKFSSDLGAITWVCKKGEKYNSVEAGLNLDGSVDFLKYSYSEEELPDLLMELDRLEKLNLSVQ